MEAIGPLPKSVSARFHTALPVPNASFTSESTQTTVPGTPPTPGNPAPYQTGWNPLAHGKPTLPLTFTSGFSNFTFLVQTGGVWASYGAGVVALSYTNRAKGSSTGSCTVAKTSGLDLSVIRPGDRFSATVTWSGTSRTIEGYILGKTETDGAGGTTWELELGGFLALNEKRTGSSLPLYCGPRPTNSSEAVSILLRGTVLEGLTLPRGVTLPQTPQSYDNQSLSSAVGELYEGSGQWVRDSGWSITAQKPGENGSGYNLTTVMGETPYTGSYRLWGRYQVRNDFSVIEPYAYKTTTNTVKSPSTLIKLWDQGGKTETVTTTQTLGQGVVYQSVITYGYRINGNYPGVPGSSGCNPAPAIEPYLVWDKVSVQVVKRDLALHMSGVYYVVKETETKTARPTVTTSNVTTSPNKTNEVTEREYVPVEVPFPNICQKNFDLVIGEFQERVYRDVNIGGSDVWALAESTTVTSTYDPSTLPQDVGSWDNGGIQWSTVEVRGRVNDQGVFYRDDPVYSDDPGDEVQWVRPKLINRSLGITVNGTGSEISPPTQIAYAFTTEELTTAGKLRLMEQEGMVRGLAVLVPLYGSPPANATVQYNGVKYWVDAANVKVDGSGATVTLDLGVLQ